jgi:hypothetical protein
LGNASKQISHQRVLKSVNPDIQDLDAIFKEASPNLFGSGFEAKMKERAESLKPLSGSAAKPPTPKKFFRGAVLLSPKEVAASQET